jgi:bacterioferritin
LPSRRTGGVTDSAGAAEKGRQVMRGDAKVIDYLNRGLRSELTAINQYWLHYRILDNWGFKELAEAWRKESMEEMDHADHFVQRILFLDGFPNMQTLDPLRIGQSVEEIIQLDLATELDARALYLEAANYCMQINDRVTKVLFEEVAESEEKHIDLLEQQIELIKQVGIQLYSQKHIGDIKN